MYSEKILIENMTSPEKRIRSPTIVPNPGNGPSRKTALSVEIVKPSALPSSVRIPRIVIALKGFIERVQTAETPIEAPSLLRIQSCDAIVITATTYATSISQLLLSKFNYSGKVAALELR